jgi:hypothetical protein
MTQRFHTDPHRDTDLHISTRVIKATAVWMLNRYHILQHLTSFGVAHGEI